MYLRCKRIIKPLEMQAKQIINSFLAPDELKILMKQRDLNMRDLLWYLAEHNIYSILDAKVMDRILQDFWNSNIDVSGTFMDASTFYQILKKSKFVYTKDEEKERRFYLERDSTLSRPHLLTFEVWKKSMFVRYMIEMLIFFGFALYFQFEVTLFNKSLHQMREAIKLKATYQQLYPSSF